MKPYAAYKAANLSWLETLPEHWAVHRAKGIFKCLDVRSVTGDEELLTVSSKQGVVPRRHANVTMFKAESYLGYKLCWPHDLVINSLWAWAGGLGFSRHHGIVSSAYGVYRLKSELAMYWLYFDFLLRSTVYDWEFHVRSKGIWTSRLQLTDESFLDMPLLLPPPQEAEAICRFVLHVDRFITRLIRAKRQLIELLNEQKQTIIHHTVTQGLDSNIAMKPSGIEWVGMIPKHWTVMRTGTVASSLQTGPFGSQLHAEDYESGGVPVINPSHMKHGKIVPDQDCAVGTKMASKLERHRLEAGDIVLARRGELGRCALVRSEETGWLCGTGSIRMRLQTHLVDAEYLLQLLLSKGVAKWLSLQSVGSTMENLNTGILARLPLPIPPPSEQRAIVAYIREQRRLIDNTVDRANCEIDLVREYRTRLIADVVTGKLDVRGVDIPDLDASPEWIGEEVESESEEDDAEAETDEVAEDE